MTGLHDSPAHVLAFFYDLALTSISLIDRPVTYEGRVSVDFFE